MRTATLTLLLMLASITVDVDAQPRASAQALTFDRERFRIPYTKYVLDNGLTLLVHEDHSTPIVAVNVWYHVGSRNERRGRTGFAHLFEHFFFNGSEHHPHGFREAMDDLGANNRNGTTNADRTNFFEDVPVAALERTLFLEADRMGFLAGHISQEMLERERGVVKNEKRQNENQPYGRVLSTAAAAIYPYDHPHSWPTIGSMEDLDAATLEDIKEWYRTYYGPNNAVLTLAGDITPERALELVRKYFEDIPPGPPLTRLDEWVPRFERSIRQTMEDRVTQTRIYRAYHVPGWGDRESLQLSLFASVLSGSKSAPLDRRLVYEKELATSVSAWVSDAELTGVLWITATLRPGADAAVVEREIEDVVAALVASGPGADELARARSRALAGFVRGIERLGGFGGRSDVLNESMTFGGSPDAYLDHFETMARATPKDVRAASQKWIGDAHHYTLHVVPHAKLSASPPALDRSVVPPIGAASDSRFPAVQRATLTNGLRVMLLERHATPLVTMALAVDAGTSSDPAASAGTAALALGLMEEGTTTRDAYRIVDELDAIGAEISTSNSLDRSIVRMSALSMNLAPALEIYADVVRNPAFDEARFSLRKANVLSQIAQQRSDPSALAGRILPGILYGPEHPYGRPAGGIGSEATVTPLTREALRSWHRTWFRPNNATLVVTGDITMEALVPALERAFGAWKGGDVPAKAIATTIPTPRRAVYLVDRPGAQQSLIVAAHTMAPSGQEDDLALEIAMRNFGGIATSRLNRNLRLEKHWTYGAYGGVRSSRGPRTFSVVTPVQSDRTKEAMVEIAREIRAIAGERPIAGEEFASTMRNTTMRLPARFETLDNVERAALEIVSYELPDDYWTRYPTLIRELGEADLATAAKRHVRPDDIVWIVVGDLASIEPGIRELSFGEVVRIEDIP
jgi:zinc protease